MADKKNDARTEKKKGSFLGRWVKRLTLLAILVAVGLGGLFKVQEEQWPWEDWQSYLSFSQNKLTFAGEKTKEAAIQGKDWTADKIEELREQQREGSTEEASTDSQDADSPEQAQNDAYFEHYQAGSQAMAEAKDLYQRSKAPGHPDKEEDLVAALQRFQDAKEHFQAAQAIRPDDGQLDSNIKDINAWIVDIEKQIQH